MTDCTTTPTPCPTPADPCADFCITTEMICMWDKFFKHKTQELIDASQPDLSVINALVYGITDYECSEDSVYQCNDVIVFKGAFYKSLINENNRHPHDDNAWEALGNLTDIFSTLSSLSKKSLLSIDYHSSCDAAGSNCKSYYDKGECTAIQVDTGEVDSCGNPIFIDEHYTSKVDANVELPSSDSDNWEQLSICNGLRDVCSQLSDLPTGECT